MEIPVSKVLAEKPNTELYLLLGLSKDDNNLAKLSYEMVLRLIDDIEETGSSDCIRPIKGYTTVIPENSIGSSLNINSLPKELNIYLSNVAEFEKSPDEIVLSKKLFPVEFNRNWNNLFEELSHVIKDNLKCIIVALPYNNAPSFYEKMHRIFEKSNGCKMLHNIGGYDVIYT